MSEQNLLNYNLFKTNDNNLPYNFEFPIATTQTIPDQRKVAIATTTNHNANRNNYATYNINQSSSPYYLPPITASISHANTSLTFSSIIQQKQLVMDQSEQWDNDVSQSAIIINEKMVPTNNNHSNGGDHLSIESLSDDQAPTHIVSPEAIREALKEETEEALGHSKRRPFSQYSSFHALKQRRFSSDNSPPSLSIPFSPPPSVKLKVNYDEDDDEEDDDEEDYEEPETPFPTCINNNINNKRYRDTTTPVTETKNIKKISILSHQEKLKRPPNAYLLFNRDMRRKLLKVSPKMTVAEISKEVGDWWKALPDNKREYYVREASILKEEHLKKYPDFIYTRRSKAELAEAKKSSKLGRKSKSETVMLVNNNTDDEDDDLYSHQQQQSIDLVIVNNNNNNNNLTTTSATTITSTTTTAQQSNNIKKRSRKSISSGGQRDPRGRKKKRHKHPFAPKHPMSAYLYYLASVYPQVSLNFPGSTVGPISKSISKTWHAMTVEERLPWKQKAESDKARYAREMQIYMANNEEQSKLISQQQEQQQQQQQLLQQQQQLDEQQRLQHQFQHLISDEEASTKDYEEEGDDEEEEDAIAAVVNMVNNGGSLMYNSPQ